MLRNDIVMFWLGLLLPVCFVPGYTGASVPTQWAVLSAILPLTLWSGNMTSGHKVLLWFLAYAALGLLWAANPFSWGFGLWSACIWVGCFHLGTLCADLRSLWRGLSVGLTISAIVACFQAWGYQPVEVASLSAHPGLLYNPALTTIACGLVLLALVCHKLWWYIPGPALGLVLSGSRGGFAVLALGLAARLGGWVGGIAALTIGLAAFALSSASSDMERIQLWGVAVAAYSWLGNAAGSFNELLFIRHSTSALIHPEYVHNDILQLVYEFGPAAAAPIFVFGMALSKSKSRDWPVMFAFCATAGFFFPLYAPLLAFIGLVIAGHLLRRWGVVGAPSDNRRSDFLSWFNNEQFPSSVLGR